MIIINTNRYNAWVRQLLLAAKLYNVECDEIEYRATMAWEGDHIPTGFNPVPYQLIDTNSCQVEAELIQPTSPKIEKPEFGPRPDVNSTDFNFKIELDWLPFQLNIWNEANLTGVQQSHFINLIYDNKEVSPYMMKTWILQPHKTYNTDKPVYMLHCTILRQLQVEVCKSLDIWLCQGII